METRLRKANVRLVIAAEDRRLVSAIATNFLDWWHAKGHKNLVLPGENEILPGVSWQANTASTVLSVSFGTSSFEEFESEETLKSAAPASNAVPIASTNTDGMFEIIDARVLAPEALPAVEDAAAMNTRTERRRLRKGPVSRLRSATASGLAAMLGIGSRRGRNVQG